MYLVTGGGGFIGSHLVRDLEAILERAIHPVYEPERPGDIHESVADIELLRAVLGYRPAVPFARGLAWTVQAYDAGGAPT